MYCILTICHVIYNYLLSNFQFQTAQSRVLRARKRRHTQSVRSQSGPECGKSIPFMSSCWCCILHEMLLSYISSSSPRQARAGRPHIRGLDEVRHAHAVPAPLYYWNLITCRIRHTSSPAREHSNSGLLWRCRFFRPSNTHEGICLHNRCMLALTFVGWTRRQTTVLHSYKRRVWGCKGSSEAYTHTHTHTQEHIHSHTQTHTGFTSLK